MNIREAINKTIKEKIPITTFWGEVKKVGEKNCKVKNILNELDYEEVLMGLGDMIIVPKENSKVLCGMINNQSCAFLIYAEEIEKVLLNGNEITFKSNKINLGSTNGEKAVRGESLNSLLQEIITHLQTLSAALVSYGTAQAAELPVIAASNTALVSAITPEVAKIGSWVAKLQNHLSNNVKID